MQYVLKNTSKITLAYLLRRRKISLNDFILNRGVKSYDELCVMCQSMGCLAPDEVIYLKCLSAEKKIEPEVQIVQNLNKKKRKIFPEEEIIVDEPKSE